MAVEHESIEADSSQRETGADQVYRRLRDSILNGRLAPGATMSQVQLARDLGVSRTPLREALRILQREGLVEGEANRMVRVAPLSTEDIEELYAIRITNEALGIRLTVPAMDSDDDAFIDDCLREMARQAEAGDIDAWERSHLAFHARLVRGAGGRLGRLLSELSDHSERYRRLYIAEEPRAMSVGASEHQVIADACRERDASLAAAELARHLSRTALNALMTIAPENEPVKVRVALRAVLGSTPEPSPTAEVGSRR
jgi:GntR family transcriptional regulator, rspAB operon transcriptional repressor